MTPKERQALRETHRASDGRNEWWNKTGEESPHCDRCGCGEYYVEWPCDVIKVLDALDEADRRAVANYERGYDDGYKGSVADTEWDNWADGNDD